MLILNGPVSWPFRTCAGPRQRRMQFATHNPARDPMKAPRRPLARPRGRGLIAKLQRRSSGLVLYGRKSGTVLQRVDRTRAGRVPDCVAGVCEESVVTGQAETGKEQPEREHSEHVNSPLVSGKVFWAGILHVGLVLV